MMNLKKYINALTVILGLFVLPIGASAQLTCLGSLDMVPVLGNASGMPVQAQPLTAVPVSCVTGSFGTIDANASGGTGAITYTWSTGAIIPVINNLGIGTYTVNVTDAVSCTGSASVVLNYVGSVAVNLTGNPLVGCNNPTANLAAQTGFDNYTWNTGATSNAISTTTAGIYTVAVSYLNGCNGASTTTVVVDYTPPSIAITPTTTALDCAINTTSTLTASGGAAYLWLGATQVIDPTTAAITINTGGTYSVTATGTNGCSSTATIDISSSCDEIFEPADALCAAFIRNAAYYWRRSIFATLFRFYGATSAYCR
jgi:SprB repeat